MISKERCPCSPYTTHWEGQQSETPHTLSWELDKRITWNFIQDFCPVSLRELQRYNFIHPKATAQDLSFQHPFLWRWAGLHLFPSELSPCTPKPSSKRCLCQVSSPPLLQGLKHVLPSSQVNTLSACFWLLCLGAILSSPLSDTQRTRECKSRSQRERAD